MQAKDLPGSNGKSARVNAWRASMVMTKALDRIVGEYGDGMGERKQNDGRLAQYVPGLSNRLREMTGED